MASLRQCSTFAPALESPAETTPALAWMWPVFPAAVPTSCLWEVIPGRNQHRPDGGLAVQL